MGSRAARPPYGSCGGEKICDDPKVEGVLDREGLCEVESATDGRPGSPRREWIVSLKKTSMKG